ncbi:MAG: SAM hydrolase/SAM-dependent halogenase family protein, partial [Thermoplasmata archaeon]
MKAVLYRSLPPGSVVDLAHDLPAHAVRESAFLLRHMARGFPPGTIHLGLVDPGVGGARAALVIACRDGSRLVGPDNGVLRPLAEELGFTVAHRLRQGPTFPEGRPSPTFDGRDLFAPAAARLALGAAPAELGPRHVPVDLVLPGPVRRAKRASGELVHVDRFGNLITNVPAGWRPDTGPVEVRISRGPLRAARLVDSYSELGFEELGVLTSSFGVLEVARREGPASELLGASVGDPVEFTWRPSAAARSRAERKTVRG